MGDIATLEYGKSLRGYEKSSGRYRVFGTNGPIGWHDSPLSQHRTVVVGRKGAYRGVHFSAASCYVIDTAFYLAPKVEFDMRWAYYELLTQDINSMDSGSAIPSTSRDEFYHLPVHFPPLNAQRAIARVLGTLDDKIELNRRMNETLEAMARAVFQDWFINFGPTRSKIQGRPPYLTPDEWSVFPDRLDDEGKPEGWRNGTLRELAFLNPENWSRSNYPAQIQYVDLSNTKWGTIGSTEAYSKETAPSRAQRVLRPGDTIVGTVRPGNGSYAFIAEDGLTGSTGFAVLRPKEPHFRELIYLSATSSDNIDHLAHLADGGAYPAIKPEVVLTTKLPGFSDDSAMCFARSTGALLDRVEANKQESRTLSAMRGTLLPKLLSGELRLKEPEKFVEAVKSRRRIHATF
jgi:type I restriction enzyme, S subunit